MITIALNGFGRIGKNFLRILCEDPEAHTYITIKAINMGPADPRTLEYMIRYDSILGTYAGSMSFDGSVLLIGKYIINVYAQTDATKLPWKSLGIDWVVEVSGHYTERTLAQHHIDAGAHAVLISAPASGEDITIIPGVNEQLFDKNKHTIVSLGSCTTNAVVPLLHVIQNSFGIESAMMNTAHAYTNTQELLDVNASHDDMRRSRAAAVNIVPSTTGAMKVVERVLPELKGLLGGCALRVPVDVVSIVDLTFIARTDISTQKITQTFVTASQNQLRGVLATSTEPLVSSDYKGNAYSVTVDIPLTSVVGRLGKVFGWYDNEYGYSCRLKDFLLMVARK